MKHNIFRRSAQWAAGMLLVPCSLYLSSCNDDIDGSPASGNLVVTVETGSADPLANSVTLHGIVSDMSSQAGYSVGFVYGGTEQTMSKSVTGTLDGTAVTATVTDLTEGQTVWYKAFLKMGNGKLVRYGEAKSTLATSATATTGDATPDVFKATLKGASTNATPDAKTGFVVCGTVPDPGDLAAELNRVALGKWLRVLTEAPVADISIEQLGLMPSTTYYYAALLDLGAGQVYGDIKSFTTKDNAKTIKDYDADLVDLGLSTKWCKYNLGGDKAGDLGGYFAFGDVTGVNISLNLADDYPEDAAKDIYKTALDVAFKSTGCMTLPSAAEWDELFAFCKTDWTTHEGVPGLLVTGRNVAAEGEPEVRNTIFLPAAGYRQNGEMLHQGTYGHYATGSVNGSSYVGYEFAEALPLHRESFHRFAGLSVRPVSTAKYIAFDKSMLVGKKWKVDLRPDGGSVVFSGPVNFCNRDVSWESVTCGVLTENGSLGWEPAYNDFKDWGVDGCPAADLGTMEFSEDGKVTITGRYVKGADGKWAASAETETGTYTVNEADKTISLSIDALCICGHRAVDGLKELKVLQLTNEKLQLAVNCDDGNGIAFNYVSLNKYQRVELETQVNTSDWNTWGSLDKASAFAMRPEEEGFYGIHTAKINGDFSNGNVMCALLTFKDFLILCPNDFVFVNSVKIDGEDAKFDANNIRYVRHPDGKDDDGNYKDQAFRIELMDAFGKTGDPASPSAFGSAAKTGKQGENSVDPNIKFSKSLEVTYTIVKGDAGGNSVTIKPIFSVSRTSDWGAFANGTSDKDIKLNYDESEGTWSLDSNNPSSIVIKDDNPGDDLSGKPNFYGGADGSGYMSGVLIRATDVKVNGASILGTDKGKLNLTTDEAKKVNGYIDGCKDHRFNFANPWAGYTNTFFGCTADEAVETLKNVTSLEVDCDVVVANAGKPFAVPIW